MALSANTPLTFIRGEQSEYPQAAVVIYEGAMLGDNASGYARGLVAGDPFIGHSTEYYDNSAGSAGDNDIKRMCGRYRLQVTLSSVAITDVGQTVYASADDTLTLTQGSNSRVGVVDRYVTTDTAVVEFQTSEGAELGDLTLEDGGDLTLGTVTGSKIGTAAAQKLGFWGLTAVVQPSHVADPAATAASPDALTATAIAAADATTPGTGADASTPSGAEYTTCADLANELKLDYTALLADVTSIRTQVVALLADVQANNASIDSILAQLATIGLQAAS